MIGWTSSLSRSRCSKPNGTLVWTTRDGPRPGASGDKGGLRVDFAEKTKRQVTRHTCAAFPVVHGDVADAAAVGEVLGPPAETKDHLRREEEAQSKPGRVLDTV